MQNSVSRAVSEEDVQAALPDYGAGSRAGGEVRMENTRTGPGDSILRGDMHQSVAAAVLEQAVELAAISGDRRRGIRREAGEAVVEVPDADSRAFLALSEIARARSPRSLAVNCLARKLSKQIGKMSIGRHIGPLRRTQAGVPIDIGRASQSVLPRIAQASGEFYPPLISKRSSRRV